MPQTHPICLVIVSEFETGPKTWQDEDACLRASMADTVAVPAQIIVAASAQDADTPHPDWSDLGVPIEVVFVDSEKSGEIKNGATAHVQQDLVAVVEADCVAEPGWLDGLYQTWLKDPSVDAVSALTTYAPTSSLRRVASLFDRGYLYDLRADGTAEHISNNGALYTKSLLERFPYDGDASPYVSAERRLQAMHQAGVRIALASDALQYHAFDGWNYIRDLYKNKGLQYGILHQNAHDGPVGWTQRVRRNLRILEVGLRQDRRRRRRLFGQFCKPHDWPLAMIYPLIARLTEIRGASLAVRGHDFVPGSPHR